MNQKPSIAELEKKLANLTQEIIILQESQRALKESEAKYRAILQNIPEGYFEADLKGNLTQLNQSTVHIFGQPREEILGMNYRAFCSPESTEKIKQAFNGIYISGNPVQSLEHVLIRPDGEKRHIEMSISLIRDGSVKPAGFCGLFRDITERKKTENMLKIANDQLESGNQEMEKAIEHANVMALKNEITNIELDQIFNTSIDGMWVIDTHFHVQRANNTLCNLVGSVKEQVLQQTCFSLFDASICRGAQCPMNQLVTGAGIERVELDIEKKAADGTITPFILTATPFRGLDGELIGIVEAFKNISERKRAEAAIQKANRELERLARIDGLTQVANRRTFDESLDKEWHRSMREKKPLTLIMCDVDCFKAYNDTYGHQLGDDCLKAIANAIHQHAKRSFDLVARYGGEEFVVILPNTGIPGAVHVAESIRMSVLDLKMIHAKSIVHKYVTLSLGLASIVPAPHFSPQALIQAADTALYEAKRDGRNQYVIKQISA